MSPVQRLQQLKILEAGTAPGSSDVKQRLTDVGRGIQRALEKLASRYLQMRNIQRAAGEDAFQDLLVLILSNALVRPPRKRGEPRKAPVPCWELRGTFANDIAYLEFLIQRCVDGHYTRDGHWLVNEEDAPEAVATIDLEAHILTVQRLDALIAAARARDPKFFDLIRFYDLSDEHSSLATALGYCNDKRDDIEHAIKAVRLLLKRFKTFIEKYRASDPDACDPRLSKYAAPETPPAQVAPMPTPPSTTNGVPANAPAIQTGSK